MSMVTLTSTHSTNLSQTLPLGRNNGSPRDVSFSSFMSGAEENHVRKLTESNRELIMSPKIITNQDDQHHYSGRKKEEDGEIGVFGAERYFSGGIDVDSPRLTKNIDEKKLEFVKDERVDKEPIKPVTQLATPSVRSELSWNSQSALLQSVIRNPPRQKSNKANRKSFLSSLAGCKCYCSDRNSIDIEEVQVGEISFKRPANGEVHGKQIQVAANKANLKVNKQPAAETWMKEDLFTFPTTNLTVGIRPLKVPLQGDVDEIGRQSLEVFGSPVIGRNHKSFNLERKLKMLSWDATPKAAEETDQNSKGNNYNDTESDASSDLFEIESLTGKANPFLARQASDPAASGCATPTTCYAPSEVSIEWSVVTASAADFSVMSDYDERRTSTTTIPSPLKTFSTTITNAKTKNNNNEFLQRRRSSGLLGCNSQKAVKVAGDAYQTNENRAGCRVSDSYMPATRFRSETTVSSFEPAETPRIIATRSLPISHSPQASHLLYIQ